MSSPTPFPHLLTCLAAAVLFLSSGCSAVSSINPFGSDEEQSFVVTLAGDSLMNNGNAAQVVVYQLSGVSNFQRTPLETFWRNDREALGEELVGTSQQVFLYPGEEQALELDLEEPTRYLGVAANLRSPAADQWRRSLPVREVTGRRVTVQIGTNRLLLNVPKPE